VPLLFDNKSNSSYNNPIETYKELVMSEQNFVSYMLEFYGKGGVYPQWEFTGEEIRAGLRRYLSTNPEFCGDSIDREAVRDIILSWRQ
jgi:hypothetical protein